MNWFERYPLKRGSELARIGVDQIPAAAVGEIKSLRVRQKRFLAEAGAEINGAVMVCGWMVPLWITLQDAPTDHLGDACLGSLAHLC